MKIRYLLLICCLVLTGCSSAEEKSTTESAPATLKHLQQDKINKSQADGFTVSLTPEPLTAAHPIAAIITGCREPMNYTWSVNGVPLNEETTTQLAKGLFKRGNDVSLEATCGNSKAEALERVQNSPPIISAVKFANPNIVSGTDLTVIPEADDADGDQIEYVYQWSVNGQYLDAISGAVLPGEYVAKHNEIMLEVVPADPFDDGEIFSGISFNIPNSPPNIDSLPPQTFTAQNYAYQVVASDPDGETLLYSLEEAPPGMQISSAGLISWPLENVDDGEYEIEIVVEDPDGFQARQAYSFNLTLSE